jgi:cold shock CspA family protein
MSKEQEVFMIVRKYLPTKNYGFLVDSDERQAFFHESCFERGRGDEGPPPVTDERVLVSVDFSNTGDKNVPRATRIRRIRDPYLLEGKVIAFNPDRGYGFIEGPQRISYYLHRSEIKGDESPEIGDTVRFYVGELKRGARASYVELNPGARSDESREE